MMNLVKRLWTEEEGQGMTEYGLIVGIISVALIAVLFTFKDTLAGFFTDIQDTVDAESGTS